MVVHVNRHTPKETPTMRALVVRRFGEPDSAELIETGRLVLTP